MTNCTTNETAPLRRKNERGQAGLFVVVNLTILFSVLGLAVDVGWAYYKRHAAQSAADAAALAASIWAGKNGMTCGSGGLVCGSTVACAWPNVNPPTNALQEACLYAESNGFLNTGSQSVTAQANTTAPPGVTGNNPSFWVQVTVSESPFTLFGNFAHVSAFNVNSQAIAGISATPNPNDIFTLDSGNSPGLQVTGSSSVTIASGGIYVNSSAGNGLLVSGSSSVNATQVKVHGGSSVTGSSNVTPAAQTGVAAVADPLASLTMPSVGSCDHINYSVGNSNTATLSPGVYCGGIRITGSAVATLNPGSYILNGGGLTVSNSGRLTGTSVTFFNTAGGGYSAGPVTGSGSSVITLTAPTTGTYRGLLFFQDRNITYGSANSFGGSTTATLTGTLYFPTTSLSFTGSSAGTTTTSFVVKTLTLTGSSSFRNDTNGTKSALTALASTLIN